MVVYCHHKTIIMSDEHDGDTGYHYYGMEDQERTHSRSIIIIIITIITIIIVTQIARF
jgi:hypothetical protein